MSKTNTIPASATKLVAVVSDPHVGSAYGLWPAAMKNKHQNVVAANPLQEVMLAKWKEGWRMIRKLCGRDKFSLVINGDVIEGIHHRTTEVTVASEGDMVDAAVELVKPLADAAHKTFVSEGTECHTKELERHFGKSIGAELCQETEAHVFPELRHKFHGCLVHAAHHMPVTSRAYLEASAMSIIMGNSRVNHARQGWEVPKVFLRAHRHVPGFFSDLHGLFVVTGGWQMLTRHGRKVVPESLPTPSITLLDWRGRPEGSLPAVYNFAATFDEPASL